MKNLEDTERYLINSFDEGDSLNSFRNLNSSTIYSDGAPIKLKELRPTLVSRKRNPRLRSLDTLCGIVIIYWLFVVTEGDSSRSWWIFKSSSWDGIRPLDCVMGIFLFIVGFSLFLNLFNKPISNLSVWIQVFRKTLFLFLIGLFINFLNSGGSFHTLRIMGVLQRISICYFVCSLLFLLVPIWLQRLIVLSMLSVYLGFLYGFDVPPYHISESFSLNCGRGQVTEFCNVAGYFDRQIFRQNMLLPTDPQGLFSTLSAITTTWIGVEFGRLFERVRQQRIQRKRQRYEQISNVNVVIGSSHWFKQQKRACRWELLLFIFAVLLIVVNFLLSIRVPFNQYVWSVSYALFTAGVGAFFLGIFWITIDKFPRPTIRKKLRTCSLVFRWFGLNMLVVYALVSLEVSILQQIPATKSTVLSQEISCWTWIFHNTFLSWISNVELASFVMAWCHFVLWLPIVWILSKIHWQFRL